MDDFEETNPEAIYSTSWVLKVYIEQIEKKQDYRQLECVNKDCVQYLNSKGWKGYFFFWKEPYPPPRQIKLIEAKDKKNKEMVEDM